MNLILAYRFQWIWRLMKKFFLILLITVSLTYPLLVYYGLNQVPPAVFAAVLFLVVVARVLLVGGQDKFQFWMFVCVGVFCAWVFVVNSERLLRYYPVIISLIVALLFLSSLRHSVSFIERVARATGQTITENAKRYTRRLTFFWGVVLLINSSVAWVLAELAPFSWWALYCGVLSYLIFGAIFIGELLFRKYYISRYGA